MSNTKSIRMILLVAIVAAATMTAAPARADNAPVPVTVTGYGDMQQNEFGTVEFSVTFKNTDGVYGRTIHAVRFAFLGLDSFGKVIAHGLSYDCVSNDGYAYGAVVVSDDPYSGCHPIEYDYDGNVQRTPWRMLPLGGGTVTEIRGAALRVRFSDGSIWTSPFLRTHPNFDR